MKKIIFSLFLALPLFISGQTKDSIKSPIQYPYFSRKITEAQIDRQVEEKKAFWAKLIPDHHKLQFAGGMGMFNLSTGWSYGRKSQWETDLYLGFIPKFSSNRTKLTMTLKQTYIPWQIDLNEHFSFNPLTTGLYMNTVLDPNFWVEEPDKYPDLYYKFSTRIRFHAFMGQSWNYTPIVSRPNRCISFFYEVSACDLYIISAVPNKSINLSDILVLSLGVKVKLATIWHND